MEVLDDFDEASEVFMATEENLEDDEHFDSELSCSSFSSAVAFSTSSLSALREILRKHFALPKLMLIKLRPNLCVDWILKCRVIKYKISSYVINSTMILIKYMNDVVQTNFQSKVIHDWKLSLYLQFQP